MLGTKEDFELIRQQVNIEAVADMLMRKQGRAYIYPGERTGSVYIYPKTNTFYDFGRAVGGDVIRLWSHIKGCNSWTALKEMIAVGSRNQSHTNQLLPVRIRGGQGQERTNENRNQRGLAAEWHKIWHTHTGTRPQSRMATGIEEVALFYLEKSNIFLRT